MSQNAKKMPTMLDLELEWIELKEREDETKARRKEIEKDLVSMTDDGGNTLKFNVLRAVSQTTYSVSATGAAAVLARHPEQDGVLFQRQFKVSAKAYKEVLEAGGELAQEVSRVVKAKVNPYSFSQMQK